MLFDIPCVYLRTFTQVSIFVIWINYPFQTHFCSKIEYPNKDYVLYTECFVDFFNKALQQKRPNVAVCLLQVWPHKEND